MRADGLPFFILSLLVLRATAVVGTNDTDSAAGGQVYDTLVNPNATVPQQPPFDLQAELEKLPKYLRDRVDSGSDEPAGANKTVKQSSAASKQDKVILKVSPAADPFVRAALQNRITDEEVKNKRRRLMAQHNTTAHHNATQQNLTSGGSHHNTSQEDPCVEAWELHTVFLKALNVSSGGWINAQANPHLLPLGDNPIVGNISNLIKSIVYGWYTGVYIIHCNSPEDAQELVDILQEVQRQTGNTIIESVRLDVAILGTRWSTAEKKEATEQLASMVRGLKALTETSTNDPYNSLQYHLTLVRAESISTAPGAWERTTGSRDVVVAVVDTGLDINHPDITQNLFVNTGDIANNGIDDDNNGKVDDRIGWDFVDDDSYPQDDDGHGTHVAGIIGAVGNNAIGISGVSQRIRILPIKVLDQNGTGSLSDIFRGLDYALAMGAHIISNSYGGEGVSGPEMNAALAAIQKAGVLFVAAAGNAGQNNDRNPTYPASAPNEIVVSVAASDQYDQLASFSNYGATSVDLAAPGVQIVSLKPGARYQDMSGTSQATPVVSGAAALLMAAMEQRLGRPFAGQGLFIKQLLLASVDKMDEFKGLMTTGGRLNVARAMDILLNPNTTIPKPGQFAPMFPSTDGTGGLVNPGDLPAAPQAPPGYSKPNAAPTAAAPALLVTLLLAVLTVFCL